MSKTITILTLISIICFSVFLWNPSIFSKDEFGFSFKARASFLNSETKIDSHFMLIQENTLMAINSPASFKKKWVLLTAYSSTPDQTDSTPFITASGTKTRNGVIACNFLSFGTEVVFPDLFGDKIFVVEDRMHHRNWHKMDIWFSTREGALEFGGKLTEVIIL